MSPESLRQLLQQVQTQQLPIDDAVAQLRDLPYQELGYATLDHHRALRQGFPEVVFGAGKTPAQIAGIVENLSQRGDIVLVTRASPQAYEATLERVPAARYETSARLILVDGNKPKLAGKAPEFYARAPPICRSPTKPLCASKRWAGKSCA